MPFPYSTLCVLKYSSLKLYLYPQTYTSLHPYFHVTAPLISKHTIYLLSCLPTHALNTFTTVSPRPINFIPVFHVFYIHFSSPMLHSCSSVCLSVCPSPPSVPVPPLSLSIPWNFHVSQCSFTSLFVRMFVCRTDCLSIPLSVFLPAPLCP